MSINELFMHRCLKLAEQGAGYVSPNPMVGAVLVHDNSIIGEGYHQSYGGLHAEVNAINDAISRGHEALIRESVLYVSLEPCSHTGKTPPCTDLILKHKIPTVVIGCRDPFPEVNGSGIKRLTTGGVDVHIPLLEDLCIHQNRRFFCFHLRKRPFVLIKYAQTSNHFIAPLQHESKKISNELTDIHVHKWRSEEDAILVGTRTVQHDNPRLNVRNWKGRNPLRITIDRNRRLTEELHLFDGTSPTLIFNEIDTEELNRSEYVKIDFSKSLPEQILEELYRRKILSLMVEGGNNTLTQFIGEGLWDEARIITSPKLFSDGIKSPEIHGVQSRAIHVKEDTIQFLSPVCCAYKPSR